MMKNITAKPPTSFAHYKKNILTVITEGVYNNLHDASHIKT